MKCGDTTSLLFLLLVLWSSRRRFVRWGRNPSVSIYGGLRVNGHDGLGGLQTEVQNEYFIILRGRGRLGWRVLGALVLRGRIRILLLVKTARVCGCLTVFLRSFCVGVQIQIVVLVAVRK